MLTPYMTNRGRHHGTSPGPNPGFRIQSSRRSGTVDATVDRPARERKARGGPQPAPRRRGEHHRPSRYPPDSTVGDLAKPLNLDPEHVATCLTQLTSVGEIQKASDGYGTQQPDRLSASNVTSILRSARDQKLARTNRGSDDGDAAGWRSSHMG
jgi:hypothetical protein